MRRNFLVLVSSIILLAGCGGGAQSSSPSNPTPAQTTALVSGKVLTSSGQPVVGATVTSGSTSVQSAADGSYQLTLTPSASSVIVLAKKDGYSTNAKQIYVRASETSLLDVTLFAEDTRTTISGIAGGTVTASNNASVTIAPNSVQTSSGAPYTGTVTISASYINPDTLNGAQGFPEPYAGTDNGDQALLRSVGVIEVKMFDTQGNPLQLDSTKPATLTFPATNVPEGEATIPLWYYDESQQTWVRQGQATRQSDGSYVGQVSHFTLWNCDLPSYAKNGPTKIKGCVLDANGNPITHGLIVQAEGKGWRTASDTDASGDFEMSVPPNVDVYVGYAVSGSYLIPPTKLPTQLALGEVRQLACVTITTAIDPNAKMTLPPFSSVTAPFAGTYAGTYSGSEIGTFNVTVTSYGYIYGTVHSTTYSFDTYVTGTISANGSTSMTAVGSAGDATFTGAIDQSTGAATGTWTYVTISGGGSYSGHKL